MSPRVHGSLCGSVLAAHNPFARTKTQSPYARPRAILPAPRVAVARDLGPGSGCVLQTRSVSRSRLMRESRQTPITAETRLSRLSLVLTAGTPALTPFSLSFKLRREHLPR